MGDKFRPNICVDLDGTLSEYDRFKGPTVFGPPLPGSQEFVEELAKHGNIIICTARLDPERTDEEELADIRWALANWLDENQYIYHSIEAKPRAHVYIDDRAVACKKNPDRSSFQMMLELAKMLVNRTAKK